MGPSGLEPPTLEQIQRLFFRAITWPTGTRDFLAAADDETRAAFEVVFADTASFARVARVDVYADAYFYRLLSALGEMYPRLRRLVGDVPFHNLITDYLLACPSTAPDLRRAGDRLPAFLIEHEIGRRLPMLRDVAELESALNYALDCPDGERLIESELASLPAERWPRLGFSLSQPARRMVVGWDLPCVFECCDRGETAAALALGAEPSPAALLVNRRGYSVYFRKLGRLESEAIAAFERGACFETVCSELARDNPELGPAEMVAVLRRWLAEGVIGRIVPNDA
jgi:Putative DNA-binding domain